MKKIFIVFVMAFFALVTFAQKESSNDVASVWNITRHYISNVSSQTLYAIEDTVIEGYTCRKVFDNNNIYLGALRDEEDRTLFYNPESCEAITLYDYSLSAGDTVPDLIIDGEFIDESEYGIDSNLGRRLIVDSIVMDEIDGDLRKHIYFKPVSDCIFQTVKEEWIQGIGSVHGLLFPLTIRTLAVELGESLDLTCYYEKDMLIWQNGKYTDCNGTFANGPTNVAETEIKYLMYPNPVEDILYIEIPMSQEKDIHLSVYNSTGHLILEKQGEVQYIDMSNCTNGVYFVQIINPDGTIEIRKIVKE